MGRRAQADDGVVTYVCRVGHRYTGRELLIGKELMLEQMPWSSLTAMNELIVAMRELEERGDARAPSGEWRVASGAGESESAPLERINEIYARLKRGDVKGRVVLTPAAA